MATEAEHEKDDGDCNDPNCPIHGPGGLSGGPGGGALGLLSLLSMLNKPKEDKLPSAKEYVQSLRDECSLHLKDLENVARKTLDSAYKIIQLVDYPTRKRMVEQAEKWAKNMRSDLEEEELTLHKSKEG